MRLRSGGGRGRTDVLTLHPFRRSLHSRYRVSARSKRSADALRQRRGQRPNLHGDVLRERGLRELVLRAGFGRSTCVRRSLELWSGQALDPHRRSVHGRRSVPAERLGGSGAVRWDG